jgi:hypothetical protein
LTGHRIIATGIVLALTGVALLVLALVWGDTIGRLRSRRRWDKGLPDAPNDPTADEQMAAARQVGLEHDRRHLTKTTTEDQGPEDSS